VKHFVYNIYTKQYLKQYGKASINEAIFLDQRPWEF